MTCPVIVRNGETFPTIGSSVIVTTLDGTDIRGEVCEHLTDGFRVRRGRKVVTVPAVRILAWAFTS